MPINVTAPVPTTTYSMPDFDTNINYDVRLNFAVLNHEAETLEEMISVEVRGQADPAEGEERIPVMSGFQTVQFCLDNNIITQAQWDAMKPGLKAFHDGLGAIAKKP